MAERLLAITIGVLAILAGCVGSQSPAGQEGGQKPLALPPVPAAPTTASPVAAELQFPPPPAPRFLPPVSVSKEWPGAEPVVALASDGTLFLQGGGFTDQGLKLGAASVWRSRDAGTTWEDVTPPFPTGGKQTAFDYFLAVGNADRVYAAAVVVSHIHLFRSDDSGDTWKPLVVPGLAIPMHRLWIVPEGESTVHFAAEGLAPPRGFWYLRSDDRGETWAPPIPADTDSGHGSNLVAGPGGELYAARFPFGNALLPYAWYLVTSADGGKTWERKAMFPLEGRLTTGFESLAVDPAGNLYLVWSEEVEGTSLALYSFSEDGGTTWSPKIPVSATGSKGLVWAAARAPGEIGIAFYASDEEGIPDEMDARWHVDYVFLSGADTDAPRVFTTRVTPEPVHHGNICNKGPGCDPQKGEDRSLLDFLWVAFGTDGRAHLAFGSTNWEKPGAFPLYAGEETSFVVPNGSAS